MSVTSASADVFSVRTKRRCLASSAVFSSSDAMPTTPLSGVRSSWLMFARKRDFACTAASAAARMRFCSVMSVMMDAMPVTLPSSASSGVLAMSTWYSRPSAPGTIVS
jgi:hypothetical protein